MTIDRESRRPLYLQVCDELRGAIARGALPAGTRLPSTRALSRRLKVSRNTILTAYETLAADGLLTGRIGSGTRVAVTPQRRQMPSPREIVRGAQYPLRPVAFCDPEGHRFYIHS